MSTSLKDIKNFIGFASKSLGLSSLPHIRFVGSSENKKQAFGHFMSDRSKDGSITVRITDRHPIDVMRTVAHELIHHKQRTSGVRQSEQMKEDEANALAGRIMREYDTKYPKTFKDRPVTSIHETESAVPANAMGGSSSTAGTGGIDTYDPLLIKKPEKRKTILNKTLNLNPLDHKGLDPFNSRKASYGEPKKLRDILKNETKGEKSAYKSHKK